MPPEEFGDDCTQEEHKTITVPTGPTQSTSASFKDTQSASQMANTPQIKGAGAEHHQNPVVKKEVTRPNVPVKVAPRRGLKRL